jgi:hypothetical protein
MIFGKYVNLKIFPCNSEVRKIVNKLVNVGFEILTAEVMESSIFWDIMSYSKLKVNRRFGGTILPPAFILVSFLAYSSTL